MKTTTIISFVILITLLANHQTFSQWQQVKGGLYGGSVNELLEMNGNIFAATEGSGVWVSSNNGISWQSTSYNDGTVRVLIADNGKLIAGSGTFKISSDFGSTWVQKNSSYIIYALIAVNGTLFAGVYSNGVVISTNYGDSWQQTSLNNTSVYSLFNSGNTLFAGGGNGVYKSTDNGLSWVQAGLTGSSTSDFFQHNGNIFSCSGDGIYYTSNTGTNWIRTDIDNVNTREITSFGGILFAATSTKGIYTSTDNGLSWKQSAVNSGTYTSFSSLNNILLVSSSIDGVLMTSNNGASWNKTEFINYNAIDFGSINNNLFVNIKGINFHKGLQRTQDGGISWSQSSLFTDYFCTIGDILIAGGGHKVRRSSDLGMTWQEVGNGNADGWPFVVSNGTSVFASKYALQRSNDNGITWDIVPGVGSSNMVMMAAEGPLVFATLSMTALYRSTNNGNIWSSSNNFAHRVNSVAVNNNTVYCATSGGGVHVSTDQGGQWSQTSIPEDTVYSIISNNNYVIAGTSSGIFISYNQGNSWQQVSTGLPNVAVKQVYVHDGFVYAGVSERGIWKRSLSEVLGITQISSNIPNEFSLSQNYPNPFNPVTKIKFSIPAVGDARLRNGQAYMRPVQLIVYDAVGREISILVNQQLNPGVYETDWNASNYPSGVYFYSLTTGSFTKTNKMVLVK